MVIFKIKARIIRFAAWLASRRVVSYFCGISKKEVDRRGGKGQRTHIHIYLYICKPHTHMDSRERGEDKGKVRSEPEGAQLTRVSLYAAG